MYLAKEMTCTFYTGSTNFSKNTGRDGKKLHYYNFEFYHLDTAKNRKRQVSLTSMPHTCHKYRSRKA